MILWRMQFAFWITKVTGTTQIMYCILLFHCKKHSLQWWTQAAFMYEYFEETPDMTTEHVNIGSILGLSSIRKVLSV